MDWSGPVVECECGMGDSTRSDSHVSNTYNLDLLTQGVAQEIWEDNRQDDLRVFSDQPNQVNNENSEESNLNAQRVDKEKSCELDKV
ncbi:hypothetical protein V6N13_001646 [Hibiscus sabdariffa]|uniref:Uncharacterized protein n=1 Tax=Hibiscus sabdariffa TaxID=183260 RepID=A0ABR2G8W8_9ROSI